MGRPVSRLRRRLRVVAATGVFSLAVASCAGLPHSSDVMEGDVVAAPLSTPIRMHPATPVPGGGPDVILKGFLVAGSAIGDDGSGPTVSQDYRPAREYLGPGVSEGWAPGSRSALLYTGSLSTTILAQDQNTATVRASAEVVATLEADGRYVELPATQIQSLDVTLAKVGGEWRIARLPQEFDLWLDLFYFNKSYQPLTVTYASPIARTLIPDRRFFPITSGLPTELARAQLEPPPEYLRGAVTSGFPANARLTVDSVTVRDGTAELDLTAAALASGAEERRAALAQAIVTLTQATAVASVSLRSDGRPLVLVGVAGPPYDLVSLGYEREQGPEPEVVVLRTGDTLVAVRPTDLRKGDSGESGPQLLPRIDANYSKLAVSSGLRDFAAVSGDGKALYRYRQTGDNPGAGQSAQQAPFGTELVRPAFDTYQGLWLAGVAPSGAPTIWVIDTRGEIGQAQPVAVAAPWLQGQRVVALKVAPDAQRIALLLRQADGRVRIAVTGVTRGQDQRATGLTPPLFIGGQLVDAVDLTWTSAYRLTVLGRAAGTKELRATYVDLDGRAEGSELASVPGARTIVPVGGGRVGVVNGAGRLLLSVAGWWQDTGPVTDVVVP